jgi:hypothetical protein
LVALWLLLVVFFVGAWQLLNPSETRHGAAGYDVDGFMAGSALVVALVFVALVVGRTRAASRRYLAVHQHTVDMLRGDPHARAWLEGIATSGSADAALEVARSYERAGDFTRALAWCDAGMRSAQSTLVNRVATWDVAAPGLSAERAFCLAALGREDEANAELTLMPNNGYAHAGTTLFRVKLAQALARGDRPAALAIARSRGDALSLPSRDAFLVDLLEAMEGSGADAEEWSRLHAELAVDSALAAWVTHFVPDASAGQPRNVRVGVVEEEDSEAATEELSEATR